MHFLFASQILTVFIYCENAAAPVASSAVPKRQLSLSAASHFPNTYYYYKQLPNAAGSSGSAALHDART